MKIAVLGPNGQLGRDLMACAGWPADTTVTPIGRDRLDVSRLDAIDGALGAADFDVLINCTGDHKTDDVESHADRAFVINAHAVGALAQHCDRRGARLVHISTDYVFAGDTNAPYIEVDAPGPVNVYGATKLMGESLARAACRDTLVLRTASLFGVAGSSGKGGNFVETMLRVGREKGALRVVADQVMSPTYAGDLASWIVRAIGRRIAPGVYHAVNTGHASWYEFASRIIERAGVEATVEPIPASAYPLPARRPAYSALCNDRLATLIGPMPSWRDALDRYLVAKGHTAGL
ncbi:MAG: dTDP-4-dehydrorhamnose reductase [Phycisphaera sp.]|nr:dTDP-4-dehydrorhamnose reductase [Phycisphaera sp.]